MSETKSTSEVEFLDQLPARWRGRNDDAIAAFADALKSQPGKWAVHPLNSEWSKGYKRSAASNITRGSHLAHSVLRIGYQAALRDGVVYVRYVGGAQ